MISNLASLPNWQEHWLSPVRRPRLFEKLKLRYTNSPNEPGQLPGSGSDEHDDECCVDQFIESHLNLQWLLLFFFLTFDARADGTMEPSFTHPGRHLLIIKMIRDGREAHARLPQLLDFKDDLILARIHDEFALEPCIAVGEDGRTYFLG